MPSNELRTRTCGRCNAPEGVRVFRSYLNRFKWTADMKVVSRDPDFCIAPRTVRLKEHNGVLLCWVCLEAAGGYR